MNKLKVLTVLLIILFVPSIGFSEVKKTYYESGKLKSETTYKNGKKEGPFKSYYENGNLQSEGRNVSGKREGFCKSYYEIGVIMFIDTYENGKKTNRKAYDIRGKLEFDQNYPFIEEN